MAAVFVEENGNGQLYYAYTDHLGSLTAFTDQDGNVTERQAFDPWGNRRNPDDWTKLVTTPVSHITGRGYTMHEHLDDFALINMNGRVYDPQIARFLSPDPQLQAPGYWLNYNRYGYCLNNPMIYSDPSGEFFWMPIIVGAMMNVAMQGMSGNINNVGDFFMTAGIGAAAGAAGAIGASAASGLMGGFGLHGVVQTAFIGVSGGSGFLGGAAIGAAAGFTGGLVGGSGNAWANGAGFGEGLASGLKTGGFGAVTGGFIGGAVSGYQAYKAGGDFWTGKMPIPGYSTPVLDASPYINEPTMPLNRIPSYSDAYVEIGDLSSNARLATYYDRALQFEGAPYETGGMSINGMDCSGLVNRATGHTTRVWTTSNGVPPGNWRLVNVNTTSQKSFIQSIRQQDLLLWPGKHTAFSSGGVSLFHAHGSLGTLTGFTHDLLQWWIPNRGYPQVYRQILP